MRPLNFASQPFRNERLPAVLFGTASALLVGITVYHALVVRTLLPARTSKLHTEVAALEGELDRLRAESRTLQAPKPPSKENIAEWNVLKDLVDRRTFSWTGLFSRLEKVLPRNVRLVSIAPDVKAGQVVLDIIAVSQPPQAGLGLVGLLEQRPEFEDVIPLTRTEKDGGLGEYNYTMRYLPDAKLEEATEPDMAAAEAAEEPPAPTVAQPAGLQSPPAAAAGSPAKEAAAAAAPPAPAARQQLDPRFAPRPQLDPRFAPVQDVPSEKNPTPDATPVPGKHDSESGSGATPRKPTERDH